MNWLNQIPPEVWYTLGGIALSLIVQAGHQRGFKMPLLSALLDTLFKTPSPGPGPAPAPPAPDDVKLGDGRLLREILDALKRLQPAQERADK